jgi:hypothetical protein
MRFMLHWVGGRLIRRSGAYHAPFTTTTTAPLSLAAQSHAASVVDLFSASSKV